MRDIVTFAAVCVVIGLLPVIPTCACRQSPAPGTGSRPVQPDSGTIRTNVRLVNLFATVTDARGIPISDLTKDDFTILEDGLSQPIAFFGRASMLPSSIVLAIAPSESIGSDMKLEIASAKKFVDSILRPEDRVSVVQIGEDTEQLTRFTADSRTIERGIDALQKGSGISLYDAIYLASDALLDRQGRKVLVLVTHGSDTTSSATYASALRRAEEAEAMVYSIIIVPVHGTGLNTAAEHALIQISNDTGGQHYYAESIEQLDEAFQQVSEELRTQYQIAYYPRRRVSDSAFRRITLEVGKNDSDGHSLQVRHRAGYYTVPSSRVDR